jgi:hypothetical protein
MYQYMKYCEECNNGKQLGQKAICPIHKTAKFTMILSIPLQLRKIFIDPAMA